MKEYAVKIRHFRTGVWTINTSVCSTEPKEKIKQEYETLYGQEVQVVEMPKSQVESHFGAVRDSILVQF